MDGGGGGDGEGGGGGGAMERCPITGERVPSALILHHVTAAVDTASTSSYSAFLRQVRERERHSNCTAAHYRLPFAPGECIIA